MSLEGKIALVTGASMPKGTGKATALTLARMGADVAVTGFGHLEGAEAVRRADRGPRQRIRCPQNGQPGWPEGCFGRPSRQSRRPGR